MKTLYGLLILLPFIHFEPQLPAIVSVVHAATTCADLRAVEQQPAPVYMVQCTGASVEITSGQYHANVHAPGGNFQQFCPDGQQWRYAAEVVRWQTPSGRPEVCDVFTSKTGELVRNAAVVEFVHQGAPQQEISTAEHALVWNGNDLVNFDPPVPGIIVGGQ